MSENETVFNKKKHTTEINEEEEPESPIDSFYYNLLNANNTSNQNDFNRQMRLEKIRKNSFIR